MGHRRPARFRAFCRPTTGPDGRFLINRIPYYEWMRPGSKGPSGLSFTVSHPGLSPGRNRSSRAAAECHRNAAGWLSGHGHGDGSASRDDLPPAPWCVAERLGEYSETPAIHRRRRTLRDGVARGSLQLFRQSQQTASVSRSPIESAVAGQKLELPPFKLINGGFIAGQVVNASTGQPIAVTDDGQPIVIGLFGPSQPLGKAVSP